MSVEVLPPINGLEAGDRIILKDRHTQSAYGGVSVEFVLKNVYHYADTPKSIIYTGYELEVEPDDSRTMVLLVEMGSFFGLSVVFLESTTEDDATEYEFMDESTGSTSTTLGLTLPDIIETISEEGGYNEWVCAGEPLTNMTFHHDDVVEEASLREYVTQKPLGPCDRGLIINVVSDGETKQSNFWVGYSVRDTDVIPKKQT